MVASIYSVWATSIIFAHTSIMFTNMSRHRSEVYVQQFDTFWNCVYPICFAFALINAAKQQASKRSTDKVSLKKGGNKQTSISDQFDTPWNYVFYSSRICVD